MIYLRILTLVMLIPFLQGCLAYTAVSTTAGVAGAVVGGTAKVAATGVGLVGDAVGGVLFGDDENESYPDD